MQGCGSDEAGIARVLYTTESFADIKACKDPEGSFRLWTNMVNAEIRYRLCPTVLSGKADVSSISTLDQAREALTDLLVWKRLHEEYLRYVDAGCGSQPILPDITGLRYAASEEILNHEVEHASLLKSLLESVATKFDKRLRSKSLHPYTSCTEIERQIKKSKNEITKEFDRKYEDTDRKCSDEAKARRVGLNTLNRIIKEIRLKWHI